MRILPLVPLLALAACVSTPSPPAPEPVPPPASAPTPTPAPPPPPRHSNWQDAPQTPGDWSYAGGVANFGQQDRTLLTFACTRGTVGIAVAGATPGPVTIRTETSARTLAAPSLPAHDPLLDAIAFSKGRFAVEAPGAALYVPSYPEISRVIEDCR